MEMKIVGLKKAVGEYNSLKITEEVYGLYRCMLFNKNTGEVWTDQYCWQEGFVEYFKRAYNSESIVRIDDKIRYDDKKINMKNVRDYIKAHYNKE